MAHEFFDYHPRDMSLTLSSRPNTLTTHTTPDQGTQLLLAWQHLAEDLDTIDGLFEAATDPIIRVKTAELVWDLYTKAPPQMASDEAYRTKARAVLNLVSGQL